MEMMSRIEKLAEEGRTSSEISERLHLNPKSVSAYKAHITRGLLRTTEEYFKRNSYVVIPMESVRKLPRKELKRFVSLLDYFLKYNSLESLGEKTEVLAKEIILEDIEKNLTYSQIREDPRLKNVSPGTISAYLAHYSRGTYKIKKRK